MRAQYRCENFGIPKSAKPSGVFYAEHLIPNQRLSHESVGSHEFPCGRSNAYKGMELIFCGDKEILTGESSIPPARMYEIPQVFKTCSHLQQILVRQASHPFQA